MCIRGRYRAYKKELNHEDHLKRLDRKHNVFHFGDFNTSIVDVADDTVDVEKIIETKMLIEDLYRALAVSYTHLDVYKRQEFMSIVI